MRISHRSVCTCSPCFQTFLFAFQVSSPHRFARYGSGCTSLFGDAAEGQGGAAPGVALLNYAQAAVCLASQLSRVMPNVRGSMYCNHVHSNAYIRLIDAVSLLLAHHMSRAAGLRSFEQNRESRQQEVASGGTGAGSGNGGMKQHGFPTHFSTACSHWRRLALPMSNITQVGGVGCARLLQKCCCWPIGFSSSLVPSPHPILLLLPLQHISHAKLRLAAKGIGPQPDRSASNFDLLSMLDVLWLPGITL